MKKAIVCFSSEEYRPMMLALRASSLKWMREHEFMHFPLDPKDNPFREIALKRIEKCLELFDQGYQEVIHIGADWLFCSSMDLTDFHEAEALFIPHVIYELPDDKPMPMVRAGVINSDFQIWKNCYSVNVFLRQMLRHIDQLHTSNIFEYEQHWLPFALAITEARLIPYNSYGVAWYNLHERTVDKWTTLFHFSGNKYHQGDERLSIHGSPPREFTEYEKEFFESYKRMVRSCEQ